MTLSNSPTISDPRVKCEIFKNISGATLPRGASAYFVAPSDSGAGTTPNGVVVSLTSVAGRLISLWAGIVYEENGIADGAWGRFQVSGYADYCRVIQDAAVAIAVGEFLTGVASQNYLARLNPNVFSRVVALETIQFNAAPTVAGRKVMILGA